MLLVVCLRISHYHVRFIVGFKRVVNNVFTFLGYQVHSRSVFFQYVTCLFSIETWGILEWSSMLYETEFCFSLGIWLVVVQLKVRLHTGFIKQYCTRNKCEI